MKKFSLLILMVCFCAAVQAQEVKFPPVDASSADFLYFPDAAIHAKKGDLTAPVIRVIYSRPLKKGREIFGALEPFDKVYRLGANENTEIRFSKDVTIGNKLVPKGTYSLFAIPKKDKWVMILNKQTDRWGAYSYDETLDIVRVEVPVKTLAVPVEALSMTFTGMPTGAKLIIGWDLTSVELPIAFK
jgi:hypothetical protein